MPTIRQLDPHVADLIAAGEVVERPASVVKELMENAIDAGANAITVEIAHGGMALIRVTDDGCGIAPDQCQTAFLRHATSKISSEYDLEAIGTLGFRGEALAAIAAVSRVELLTNQGQGLGTALSLEGGQLVEQEEAGCPKGTTMLVRDLFFNTPARLKFMKRDSAEGAAVFAVVQRLALSHPELSVKFIRDGKQELLTPGDGQLKSAIYAVLGRDLALGFLPVKGSGEHMEISGFVSLPTCCRGSRSYQHFFVNGRYIKSRVMMAALEEAYRNQKMVGKFPGCVLHLTVRPNTVDVNVHPTKTEVKFQNEQQVFSTVYHGVLAALNGDQSRPQAVVKSVLPRQDTVTPNQTSLHDFTAVTASHGTVTTPPVAAPKPQAQDPVGHPHGTGEKSGPGCFLLYLPACGAADGGGGEVRPSQCCGGVETDSAHRGRRETQGGGPCGSCSRPGGGEEAHPCSPGGEASGGGDSHPRGGARAGTRPCGGAPGALGGAGRAVPHLYHGGAGGQGGAHRQARRPRAGEF